jgi:hypothetical protein
LRKTLAVFEEDQDEIPRVLGSMIATLVVVAAYMGPAGAGPVRTTGHGTGVANQSRPTPNGVPPIACLRREHVTRRRVR